ncbi:hypothetical protein M0R88_10710 [Halorussus gelatinilyticus]|uniref:Response regulatory domain-containing protein n=1 Tax=Halorussus gelatinilyticus TaxID=2937524 RepID=A0A8U0IG18_9EURY|nr:hypothetical protein [Halorussus gelatinilyticus]UPV98998.1 hypothetical protein M0R88_10710 [Halorussus gelatinilyticus]
MSECSEWLSSTDVTTASDGETALSAADADVDVILVPRHCEDVSGDEFVSKLRDRGIEAPAAVVLSEDADVDALELDLDDCIRRPLAEWKVRTVLDRLVKRRRYNRLLQRYYRLVTCRADPRRDEAAESETHARVEAELREVQNQLSVIEDEMAPDEYEALFRDLQQVLDDAGES